MENPRYPKISHDAAREHIVLPGDKYYSSAMEPLGFLLRVNTYGGYMPKTPAPLAQEPVFSASGHHPIRYVLRGELLLGYGIHAEDIHVLVMNDEPHPSSIDAHINPVAEIKLPGSRYGKFLKQYVPGMGIMGEIAIGMVRPFPLSMEREELADLVDQAIMGDNMKGRLAGWLTGKQSAEANARAAEVKSHPFL